MTRPLCIGNQTAVSAATPLEPFHFALANGFGAFEWFADKKWNADGTARGWDEPDIHTDQRQLIRKTGEARAMRYTVHSPWQANPLHPDGTPLLLRSIEFARDIGAELVNLHLYMDEGAAGYVEALLPVCRAAAAAGLLLSIENTPHTAPDDFNQTFASLHATGAIKPGAVGLCLDIGHANLCRVTHNDYIAWLDQLTAEVPLLHMHLHENFGDADTHLPLFTGPARTDDGGVRRLLQRVRQRDYRGVMILEQWPHPRELLVSAAERLQAIWESCNDS